MWMISSGVILALILVSGASDSLPDDYCQDKPRGGYKRHPNDCSRYVSCSGADSFNVQSCQPGLLYDERSAKCNYGGLVDCGRSPRPPTRRPPTRRPLTTHRRGFLNEITNTRRHTTPAKTFGGRNSGADMVHAVHQEDLSNFIKVVSPPVPRVRDVTVPDCARDGLYPDGMNCSRYYICSYGRPYTFNCPGGTFFHRQLLRCEFRYDHVHGQDPCGSRDRGAAPPRRPHVPARNPTAPGDMLGKIANFMEEGKQKAKAKVNKAVRMESLTAGGKAGQSAFRGVASFLGSDKVVKKMSLSAEQQLETLKIIKEKFDLSKDDVKVVMKKMHSTLSTNPSRVVPDTPRERIKMDLDTCPYPDDERRSRCRASSRYRTIDGTCNNLQHPLWGRSMTPFTRFVDPDYCDNIGCPRRGENNRTLPGARLISRTLFTSKPSQSHVHTTMLLTAGQLLDHDLTKTALSMISTDASGGGRLSEVTCGSDGCSTQGDENRACFPIEVPAGDTAFGSQRCLMFVRTQEVPSLDCQLGPRQQLNQLTHYMDASMIYGSTKEESAGLKVRERSRGRMLMSQNPDPKFKPLLPQTDNHECRDVNETIRCFKAGDDRVNENAPLTGLHVVFARLHGYIEADLHDVNPQWDGERLFQETRRVVGALWQHIIYNEYLPIILGPQAMSRYGLTLQRTGYSSVYDPSVSADIANVFATAAFRFSHSMIPDTVVFSDRNYHQTRSTPLSNVLRRPYEVYNNAQKKGSAVDSIMHGIMSQSAMRIDRHFSKQVTQHLFSENPPHGPGTDLAAINIQRGRDHGLPSYNEWRAWCNLHVARDFEDMIDLPEADRQTIKSVYADVDDVDLFAAAICERNVAGGIVGPTFACILGRQFRNLKVGDRFWYETRDRTTGFTPDQLTEIRKVTLSKLVCKSADLPQSTSMVQKYAMLRPISEAFAELGERNYAEVYSLASLYHGEQNERRPCSSLPDIDISKWKE